MIQHWPGASVINSTGLVLEGIFFSLAIYEVIRADKVEQSMKVLWLILLLLVPLIWLLVFHSGLILIFLIFTIGMLYLSIGRKAFAQKKKIEFDSV